MEEFKQAVEMIIKKQQIMTVVSGTVKAIRENEIDVDRSEDLPDLLNVRYHSVLDTVSNKFKITPKLNSQVLCAIIENDVSEAFLFAFSEIEKVEIHIDDLKFELEKDGIRISNKGENLKKVLNEFQDKFGALCDEVSKIVVAVGVTPNVPVITQIKKDVKITNKNKLNKILIE